MENINYVTEELSKNGLSILVDLAKKSSIHTRIFEDLIDECENIDGENLKDKILQFAESVGSHGAANLFNGLMYYDDTDLILENYFEEIRTFSEEQLSEDIDGNIKTHIIGNDILLCSPQTRSKLICYIYESILSKIAYTLENN